MTAHLFSPITHRRPRLPQPHRRGAHVPVFRRRRRGVRLAPAALDDAGDVRRRHGDGGDDRRGAARPHHATAATGSTPTPARPARRRALDAARRVAAPGTKFGVQLAHAGRKASCRRPWEGGGPLAAGEDPWPTVSASAIPYRRRLAHAARRSTPPASRRWSRSFAAAARRARAGGLRLHRAAQRARLPPATSSSRRSPTGATTPGAGRSRTGCGCRSRSSRRCARRCRG